MRTFPQLIYLQVLVSFLSGHPGHKSDTLENRSLQNQGPLGLVTNGATVILAGRVFIGFTQLPSGAHAQPVRQDSDAPDG